MKRIFVESWILLLRFEWIMLLLRFRNLRRAVDRAKVRAKFGSGAISCETLCRAMDYACVFYPRRVLCLQRSAATALLLRRHGFRAELIIGAKLLPFQSHAWVELDGAVVNDKPYMREIYQVLDRC